MNVLDKNGYFAVNFTCIATITYFLRFLTLVFVYVLGSSKSMNHICTTALVIRVKAKYFFYLLWVSNCMKSK